MGSLRRPLSLLAILAGLWLTAPSPRAAPTDAPTDNPRAKTPPITAARPKGDDTQKPARRRTGRITRAESAAAYRWIAHVRHRLFRVWRAPIAGDAAAQRLAADVEIAFDERGGVTRWSILTPATGEGAAAFNASLEKAGKGVKQLPRPNAGALALFLKRRIVLRFRADSPLVRPL